MRILIEKTSKDTVNLAEFYREARDPPGSGKAALCALLSAMDPSIKYVTLVASGGSDEKNTRSRSIFGFFKKDTRSFATWSREQLQKWLVDHSVEPSFAAFVMSQPKVSTIRTWVRILASNEKLVQYYKKLGFTSKYLSTTVPMRAPLKKILAHCK